MGSRSAPAPAPQPQPVAQKPATAPYTIDAKGNINVTGNINSDQLKQAQQEAKAVREKNIEANKNVAIYGNESVADVQAREQQTLANPKKARVRGRRSLVTNPIGGQGTGRETLG